VHPEYDPGLRADGWRRSCCAHAASDQDFEDVHALATKELRPGLASFAEEYRAWCDAWPARRSVIRRNSEVTGFLAPLALTAAGVAALVDNTFDAAHIDQKSGCRRLGEPLAGFYCWCYAGKDQVSRGALVLGLRTLIDRHFRTCPSSGAIQPMPVRGSCATSASSLRFHAAPFLALRLGHGDGSMMAVQINHTGQELRIEMVRDLNDYMKVVAIRSSVFLAEQDCPYDEEFDGDNDLSAVPSDRVPAQ